MGMRKEIWEKSLHPAIVQVAFALKTRQNTSVRPQMPTDHAHASEDSDPNTHAVKDRAAEWNHHCEEQCRNREWNLHKELYNIKGAYKYSYSTDFFRVYVPPEEAHPSTTRRVVELQDTRNNVDVGAFLHWMVCLPNEKKTIRNTYKVLLIQTAKGIVESNAEANVFIQELGKSV